MKLLCPVIDIYQKQVVQKKILDKTVLIKTFLVCNDQILNLEWKYLVPISMVNLLIMACCVAFGFHF